MKTSKKVQSFLLPAVLLLIGIIYYGCSNKAKTQTNTDKTETQTVTADADTVKLEIAGNDQMQYDKKELRAKAGAEVELTLKHVGSLPKAAMGHNWTLLKPGVDMAKFAQDAMTAKDNDYIPPSRTGDIIAHTKLLGGGESDTIYFKAPPIGTYTFMCTFPAHYMTMHGNFIVGNTAPSE